MHKNRDTLLSLLCCTQFIYCRFFPGSKRSTFTDSMNPRSTGTTDIEQSTKSVDSMVDNPTYCVPFPVDYHEVSIYPQKKPHPPVFPMNSLTKGVSSIDMVDNECYCVPSSLSGRDDMEQSLVAGQQFPPLEYETPKWYHRLTPTVNILKYSYHYSMLRYFCASPNYIPVSLANDYVVTYPPSKFSHWLYFS